MADDFEANTGAISYTQIDDEWHYTHWPKECQGRLDYWDKWKKENPEWEQKVQWKMCGT